MDKDELDLLRAQTGTLAGYAAHARILAVLSTDGDTEQDMGEAVSLNYFALLGVGTAIGRPLGPGDDDPAVPPVVVISHALWVRRFQADPGVVGRQVRINDQHATIVGVTRRDFRGVTDPLTPTAFWVTGAAMGDANWRGGADRRIKNGASFARVEEAIAALSPTLAEMALNRLQEGLSSIGGRLSERYVDQIRGRQFPVRRAIDVQMPFDPDARLIPGPLVAGVIAVVALVLLIATANVTGLLLARGVTRAGEVAVRRALGAGPGRIARQLLTESVLLSSVGGALGLGLAAVLVGVFRANAPARYALETAVDARVLMFPAGVCLVTGLLAGFAPARQARRLNVLHALGGGSTTNRAVRRRLRHAIVIPQVALSLVLLVVAAVQTRGLLGIELADRGYRVEGVTVFSIGRPTPRVFDRDDTRRLARAAA